MDKDTLCTCGHKYSTHEPTGLLGKIRRCRLCECNNFTVEARGKDANPALYDLDKSIFPDKPTIKVKCFISNCNNDSVTWILQYNPATNSYTKERICNECFKLNKDRVVI